MQHLDEGTIHAWIDGELPPDEASRVEAHASVCRECSALVAEARGLVAASSRIVSALDVVPSGVLPAFGAKKPPRRWMLTKVTTAIAATLVIAAGTLVTMRGRVETPAAKSTNSGAPPSEYVLKRQLDSAAPAIANAPIAKLQEPTPSPAASGASGGALERRTAQAPLAARNDNPIAGAAAAVTPSAPPAVADVSAPRIATAQPQRSAAMGKTAAAPPSAGAGVAGGTATAPKVTVMRRDLQLSEIVVTSAREARLAVARCYELDESTDILPKRFALRTDSTGVNEVRYVDSTGTVDGKIFDARWTEADGRVSISTAGRGVVLTLTRLGLGDFQAQSPLGPRAAKVATCR